VWRAVVRVVAAIALAIAPDHDLDE